MRWYIEALRKYAVFSGRATRQEYWMYVLVNVCVYGVLLVLLGLSGSEVAASLFALYWLAVLVPTLAVHVRRLHDTNRSGWFLLLSFVPLVGGILMLVFMCGASYQGPNSHGPGPDGVGFPAGAPAAW
ncbi:DUF805 domain-containing protein [Actinacidiphila yeochonensis]|uniref:DUF805 domain-containing protein n=1 Tax=Actinacidiphila yeochonensis TaxID=89050 RepID=UPI00068C7E19|nr:DUF805 domain-containing protein [Actinacidiphila yeochonensis]